MTSGKSLTPAQNERVRAAALELLERYRTKTALGAALGITQAAVSAFLSGKNGSSFAVAATVASKLGRDVMELLGEEEAQRSIVPDRTQPMWENVEGWDTAAAEVRAREKHLAPYIEQGGRIAAYRTDRPVTREMVIALASFVREIERDDGAAAAREHEEIKAETSEREARQVEAERLIREMEARGEKPPSLAMMMKRLRDEGWKPGGTKKKGAKK